MANGNGNGNIEWQAPEHEHKQRSADWFWAAGIVTVAIVFVCIVFGNTIFGILIAVCAFSLALFINRPPQNLHIAVNGEGVRREKMFYPYESLQSFWIDVEHPHNKIILRSKKLLMPLIIVPLGSNADTERLQKHLEKYLREEYHSLPLVEKIIEYLGF